MPPVPNLFVVGAPRAGTTTIYRLLQRSPEIFTPSMKEPWTLALPDLETRFEGPGDEEMVLRERSAYIDLYREAGPKRYRVDASSIYLWSQAACQAIASMAPSAKIIVCLRDPCERTASHYMWHRDHGVEDLSLREAILAQQRRADARWSPRWYYVDHSLYGDALTRYLKTFGSDNVVIILHQDLSGNWPGVVDTLRRRLDIDLPEIRRIRENRSGRPRLTWLHRIVRGATPLSRALRPFVSPTRRHLWRSGLYRWERQWNRAPRKGLPGATRAWLLPRFVEDIEAVERLVGADLRAWKCAEPMSIR